MGKWSSWTVRIRHGHVCSPMNPSPPGVCSVGGTAVKIPGPNGSDGVSSAASVLTVCWHRLVLALGHVTCCNRWWKRWNSRRMMLAEVVGSSGIGQDRKCCRRPSCSATKAIKTGCVRSYLILFNFLFLAGGVGVLGLGLYMHVDRQSSIYIDLLHNIPTSGLLILFEKLPSVFVFIGGLVAVLSFLGCCGACADSACFLSVYVLLVCLVLITELVIVSVLTIFRERILLKLEVSLQHQVRYEYNKTGSNISTIDADHVTVVLDILQIKMNCCGSVSPNDYKLSVWYNRTRPVDKVFVPSSCCYIRHTASAAIDHQVTGNGGGGSNGARPTSDTKPRGIGTKQSKDMHQCQLEAVLFPDLEEPPVALKTQGCQRSMIAWFNSNFVLVVGAVFFIGLVQVFDLLSACSLLAWVREKHSECDSSEAETEFG